MLKKFNALSRNQKLRFLLIAPIHIPLAILLAYWWHAAEWCANVYMDHIGPAFRSFVFWERD